MATPEPIRLDFSIEHDLKPTDWGYNLFFIFDVTPQQFSNMALMGLGRTPISYPSPNTFTQMLGAGDHVLLMSSDITKAKPHPVKIGVKPSISDKPYRTIFEGLLTLGMIVKVDINRETIEEVEEIIPEEEERPKAIPPPRPKFELTVNAPETIPILNALGDIKDSIWGAITGTGGAILDIASLGASVVTGFFSVLLTKIPEILSKSNIAFAETISKNIIDVTSGSPDWAKDLHGIEKKLLEIVRIPISVVMNTDKFIPKEPTPENYIKGATQLADELLVVDIGARHLATIVEASSFGQIEAFSDLISDAVAIADLQTKAKTVYSYPTEMGILEPYRQAINMKYPNYIPTYADLINMRVKEKLDEDEFNMALARQGYNKYWAGKIWDAHYMAPSYGEILKAKYRTDMTEERFLELLKIVDLDEIYNEEVWLPNVGEIPVVSELINQRVKEVIPQSLLDLNLKKWGYDPIWGKRIWDAHFIPPSLSDILTAYRRQVPVTIPEIDEETGEPKPRNVKKLDLDDVHGLMKLVDLDPRYETIFDTRLYEDPTIRDARYMFEIGAYDEAKVRDVLRRRGYNPTDQENLTKYLISFRERGYYTKYLTAVQTAYMQGAVNDAFVDKACLTPDYPKGIAFWIKEIANVRKMIRESTAITGGAKILTLGELKRGYLRDVISEDDFRIRLTMLGYNITDIDILIKILAKDKLTEDEGRRVVVLTVAQLLQAFRFDKLTEDEVKARIMLKGLDQQETDLLIETKKAQWGVDNVEVD